MALLSVQNIAKQFGEYTLFSDISFEVGPHDKWGLVGDNGCGKTTLLRLLTGEDEPDNGQVVYAKEARAGYMEQHIGRRADASLWDETLTVFAPLMAMENEIARLTEQVDREAGQNEQTLLTLSAKQETFETAGGLYFRSRTRAALLGLGFSEADLALPMRSLSGGQRSKAAMARLLLSQANLLLLDEPTNHLDMAAVEWLEDFLKNYNGAVIVVSHDRYFLDKITTRTLEIANGAAYITEGNYSVHRKKREKDREVAEKHYKTALREIRRLEDSVELLHSFNREKSVRAAESKQKMLDKKREQLVAPKQESGQIHFDFSVAETGGNEVLTAGELAMSFEEKHLFQNVALQLRRGERVFLLGPNGCGKTTLLKILTGVYTPKDGFVRLGSKISIGYYDQVQAGLDDKKTVMDEIWDAYPTLTQTEVRSALASFLFKGERVFARIGELSGGERARVLLLKLMLSRNNLLLLDEPTNHLDIRSREMLEEALEGYNGTVLAVSHDRYFINRLARRTICLTTEGCVTCDGGYDTYLEQQHTAQAVVRPVELPKENAYKQKKERESARRKLNTRIQRTEQQIAQTEEQIATLHKALEQPEIAADYEQVTRLSAELTQLEQTLDESMALWETLQTEWEEEAE